MRLFRHGSSVGQKRQARRSDVPPPLPPSPDELRRGHQRAIGCALVSGISLGGAAFLAPAGSLAFWLFVGASVLLGGTAIAWYALYGRYA